MILIGRAYPCHFLGTPAPGHYIAAQVSTQVRTSSAIGISLNTSSPRQVLEGALALHRMGNLRAAMDGYMRVLKDDPQNADALYYVAVVAVQEGQYPDGIKLAQRALSVGPAQPRLHNLLGQTYVRLGEEQEALASFDRAIELQPDFADAHGNRANVL